MNFYHIVVTVKNQKKPLCIFKDLTINELKKDFIKPYKLNKDIYYDGSILAMSELKTIKILQTKNTHREELQAIQEKSLDKIQKNNNDYDSIITILSKGSGHNDYEIEKAGINITNKFIKKAPGEGTFLSKFYETTKHPWIVRILGVSLTLILLYFGFQ